MRTELPFFDTSYVARLYLEDAGFETVREIARSARAIAAAWHGQAEVVAALHRAFRERRMGPSDFQAVLAQFAADCSGGAFEWLPLTEGTQERLMWVYGAAPATVFLRGADALHLACAADHGFREVYSNDRHFLAAAPLFGLRGVNVL